jgi:PAS domain S-box-containing protein
MSDSIASAPGVSLHRSLLHSPETVCVLVSASMGAPELRVTLFGRDPEADEWASILGARGCRVSRADTAADLWRSGTDLVLAMGGPRDATLIAGAAAESDAPPALALLTGSPHPLTRVVRAVIQAKREWEGTFDAVVDPVALLDGEGTIRRANLGLARDLGLSIRDVVGRPYHDLLGPGEGDDPVVASLRDGLPRTGEVRYARLPGLRQVTVSPLPEADGPRGLIAILKDVSELREQQERLLQAARLADVGQLAAGVAHEINTPLAAIALRAEGLLRAARDEGLLAQPAFQNFPRYLQAIDEEIFRCKKIIAALLEFSRARPPEVHDTNLNALCDNASDLLQHQMRLKQVRLEVALDPELPLLRADEGQLRQALVALLVNALDACGPGGCVRLTTAREEGLVRVSVGDDGVGIPREYIDKIFSPFFTTKPVGQGTGLGLAICHGVVTAHGGRIEVESEPGRGTRVSLLLPTGSAT